MKFKEASLEEYTAFRERSSDLARDIMSHISDDVSSDLLLHANLDIMAFILSTNSSSETEAKQAVRALSNMLRSLIREASLSGAARWSESPSDMAH